MTRVTQNSSAASIAYSIGQSKKKLEALQLQGSTLKAVAKPSDDPVGNTEVLSIRSAKADGTQFQKNSNFAKAQISFVENALSDLSELLLRAKDIAVSQASTLSGGQIRENIGEEVKQIRQQALSIANRRLGNRYIFSGFKTLQKAFDEEGKYLGDDGSIRIEVAKDTFVKSNLPGLEVFFLSPKSLFERPSPQSKFEPPTPNGLPGNEAEKIQNDTIDLEDDFLSEEQNINTQSLERGLANVGYRKSGQKAGFDQKISLDDERRKDNIFSDLESLEIALKTDNIEIVQSLIDKLDDHFQNIVKKRTSLGSITNAIASADAQLERDLVIQEEYRSQVEDSDVADLFTELEKQKNILNASYNTSSKLLNTSLLNYLR